MRIISKTEHKTNNKIFFSYQVFLYCDEIN